MLYKICTYKSISYLKWLTGVHVISIGDRLHDFKILVGESFTSGQTGATEIASWSQCAYFSGRFMFQRKK